MAKFKEHPKVTIPPWALELGFKDNSWHNDACARMTLENWFYDTELTLWVDYPNPRHRELGENFPQFGLVIEDNPRTARNHSDQGKTIYATEYSGEMERLCRLLITLPRK